MALQLVRSGLPWDEQVRTLLNRGLQYLNDDLPTLIDTEIASHVSDYHEAAPNEQTGATYTFVAADARRLNVFNRATAQTITIPTNASVAFPVGTTLRCMRKGAGLVTFSPDTGVTLNKPTGIKPNRFMGASVSKAADQTAANYTTPAVVTFDEEAFDTDAFHDNSTNPSRLTIPAGLGITRVSLGSGVILGSHTANVFSELILLKNGSAGYDQVQNVLFDGPGTTHRIGLAQISVPVTDSDYFEVRLSVETDNSITVTERSNFQIAVEAIDPQGTIAYQYGEILLLKTGTNEWAITGPGLG